MDIESTINKFIAPVEKHAQLMGAGMAIIRGGTGQGSVIGGFSDSIARAMAGGLHAPEWQNILNYLSNDEATKQALMAAIAGYFVKDLNNPTLKRVGEIAYKAGSGYAMVMAAYALTYFSTHSPAPPNFKGNTYQPESSSSDYMTRGLI